MKYIKLLFLLTILTSTDLLAQKQVYIPRFITNENMDLNNPNSQWCYCRSRQTDNIIVFWEAGFGSDPTNAASPYNVNLNTLLSVAEKSYSFYLDTLKFAIKGSSVTDNYKLMIFLTYTNEWAAYGSGQDNQVGTLHVNQDAARIDNVLHMKSDIALNILQDAIPKAVIDTDSALIRLVETGSGSSAHNGWLLKYNLRSSLQKEILTIM